MAVDSHRFVSRSAAPKKERAYPTLATGCSGGCSGSRDGARNPARVVTLRQEEKRLFTHRSSLPGAPSDARPLQIARARATARETRLESSLFVKSKSASSLIAPPSPGAPSDARPHGPLATTTTPPSLSHRIAQMWPLCPARALRPLFVHRHPPRRLCASAGHCARRRRCAKWPVDAGSRRPGVWIHTQRSRGTRSAEAEGTLQTQLQQVVDQGGVVEPGGGPHPREHRVGGEARHRVDLVDHDP